MSGSENNVADVPLSLSQKQKIELISEGKLPRSLFRAPKQKKNRKKKGFFLEGKLLLSLQTHFPPSFTEASCQFQITAPPSSKSLCHNLD